MNASLINILVPTYEPRPEHLKAALDSLLAQTEQRWDVVIHDDASKANVEDMVKPYLSDPRFKFVRSSDRLGIGGNWNACLKFGSAPFVQYLFQDDIWGPEFLSSAVEVLEKHSDVGFVTLDHIYIFEGDVPSDMQLQYKSVEEVRRRYGGVVHNGPEFLRNWMREGLHPNLVSEPSFLMMRRAVMEQAGPFDEQMPQSLDIEYWVRLLARTNWYFVPKVLGDFRVHPSGTSERNRREGKGIYDRFICMERVMEHAKGHDRNLMRAAFIANLERMIRKYRDRKKAGTAMASGGSGAVKKFALRHPILFVRALIGAFAS